MSRDCGDESGPADRNLGAHAWDREAGTSLFGGLKGSVVNLKCVAAPSTPQFRLRSLDGLRGLAAAIVLLHHVSMTIPAISNGYDSTRNVAPWSFTWWVLQSPLKVLVAGPEFVLVFFILSGFVLTLSPLGKRTRLSIPGGQPTPAPQHTRTTQDPPASQRPYDWAAYYPRRIIRLGVPVVASMVLAFVVVTTLPHPVDAGDGSWLTRQAHPDTGLTNLLTETLLIADPSRPSVNPPLWSLTWELWFSLLLPVAVAIALFSRRLPVVWALVFCGISAYGYVMKVPAVMYLPAFALGGLLAANAARINAAIDRQRSRRGFTVMWAAIAVTGPMLCISYWLLRPLVHGPFADLALGMRVPGAMLMVATIAFWPAASRVFDAKPLAWLGRISFSLYLVHAPIVVWFGLMFTGQSWWIGATLSTLTSLALALTMYALVEKPSQRLALWVGSRASDATTSIRPPLTPAGPLAGQHQTARRNVPGVESAALERMPAIR